MARITAPAQCSSSSIARALPPQRPRLTRSVRALRSGERTVASPSVRKDAPVIPTLPSPSFTSSRGEKRE
ncbi:hypothetical protein C0J50_14250 [Silurus asotus]|uniref:Uncharacterized protein n=1 Tax=Silurus asotus TaxID=30991 RepID=A0AAD5FR72_SILAS|nr:hypothetical protein C0J50_14250 [Silurus asotus]